jgi:hypothetical protein
MDNNCFVCLENTKNKICDRCECYAHNKCYHEYIKTNLKIKVNVINNKIINTSSNVICPICKYKILNPIRLTRNNTSYLRSVVLDLTAISYFEDMNDDNKYEVYNKIMKIFIENKELIMKDITINNFVRDNLKIAYEYDYIEAANICHYQLFGCQI